MRCPLFSPWAVERRWLAVEQQHGDQPSLPYVLQVSQTPSGTYALTSNSQILLQSPQGHTKVILGSSSSSTDHADAERIVEFCTAYTSDGQFRCRQNPQLLSYCTTRGAVHVGDPRQGDSAAAVLSFFDPRGLACTSIDWNVSETLLAAGTVQDGAAQSDREAFIRLWDPRNPAQPFGSVSESLGDDVTQVRFHPVHANLLCSASTDGLACMFDVHQLSATASNNWNADAAGEDDALLAVMNSESSVAKLGFFGSQSEYLWMATHIETLRIYSLQTGDLLADYPNVRSCTPSSSCTTGDGPSHPHLVEYILDAHAYADRLFLLTGNHQGAMQSFHVNQNELQPLHTWTGGHSATVRSVAWDPHSSSVVSGAEDGLVVGWRPDIPS